MQTTPTVRNWCKGENAMKQSECALLRNWLVSCARTFGSFGSHSLDSLHSFVSSRQCGGCVLFCNVKYKKKKSSPLNIDPAKFLKFHQRSLTLDASLWMWGKLRERGKFSQHFHWERGLRRERENAWETLKTISTEKFSLTFSFSFASTFLCESYGQVSCVCLVKRSEKYIRNCLL